MAEAQNELLNTLMGMLGDNPEEKISAALTSLGMGNDQASVPTPEEPKPITSPLPTSAGDNTFDALLKFSTLLGSMNQEDERARLLHALKPFLSEEKQPKIENAVTILKLVKMAEAAGKTDLLKILKL